LGISIFKKIGNFDNYEIHGLYNNPHGAVAYYLNYKMALKLQEQTKVISYASDYPINLNTLGKFGAIQPSIINTNVQPSTINLNKYDDKKWPMRFRTYCCIDYFTNKINYNGLWCYICYIYSNLLYRIYKYLKSFLKL
jgi:hypothetical protein